MNLREAILAGAQRVSGRCRGHYITVNQEGEYEACLLGAAYLGCHPEADLASLVDTRTTINRWLRKFARDHYNPAWPGRIVNDNDHGVFSFAGFAEVIDELTERGENAFDIEVCNDTGGT